MRIIAGSAKGRRLAAPGKGNRIRPTSDRAREAIFSILGSERLQGARLLDLFAGTGAFGLEALSRGAASVVFVDSHKHPLGLIKQNVETCGFSDRSLVMARDLLKGLSFLQKQGPFELIFIDPPYGSGKVEFLLNEIVNNQLLTRGGLVLFEDRASEHLPEQAAGFRLTDFRKYGEAGFWFYLKESDHERE